MNLATAYLSKPSTQRILGRKPGQEGFSLIELVVVIAVLAVLTAIALPNFLGVSDDASARAAQQAVITAFKECQVQKARGNVSETSNFEPAELTDFTVSAVPASEDVDEVGDAGDLPDEADRDKCFVEDDDVFVANNFIAIPTVTGKFPKYMVEDTGNKTCEVGDEDDYEKTYNVGCAVDDDETVGTWK